MRKKSAPLAKSAANKASSRVLPVAEEVRKKLENAGISPPLFPASSGIFRNRLRKKFWQTLFVLCGLGESVALLPLLPQNLWVHRLAYPVATGKNAGDDAA